METTFLLYPFVLLLIQWDSCLGQVFLDPSFQTSFQEPVIAPDFRPRGQFPVNGQFRAPNRNFASSSQSPLLHTAPVEAKAASDNGETRPNAKNNFSEIFRAFSDFSEEKEENVERASARDYVYPAYGSPQPYGYGYSPRPSYAAPPSYGPPQSPPPPSYHESYAPPPSHHHSASKISLLKPTLDLIKPVTTKVASKVSGLIGLVLALLTGSSPDDLELKGFKDIVINGIVKPLMLAKGGIKSLISKLAIPVISLLLINLEVLITIWWLWEDCPEPVYAPPPPPPPYHKPSYNYNNY